MSAFRDQYNAFRKEKTAGVKNPLLLVKLGEFYEAFFEDARVICDVLCALPARREDGTHVILDAARRPEYTDKLKGAGYTPVIAKEDYDNESQNDWNTAINHIAVKGYRKWRFSDAMAKK